MDKLSNPLYPTVCRIICAGYCEECSKTGHETTQWALAITPTVLFTSFLISVEKPPDRTNYGGAFSWLFRRVQLSSMAEMAQKPGKREGDAELLTGSLPFLPLSWQGSQPLRWCHSHSGWVFSPQLTPPRKALIDIPRAVHIHSPVSKINPN